VNNFSLGLSGLHHFKNVPLPVLLRKVSTDILFVKTLHIHNCYGYIVKWTSIF